MQWLTSEASPLTARVWANFVWQQHFGRGLVETPGDFGLKGARPTHADLLDWLACELREHSWSTKHLHRLIVTSAAYRRASALGKATFVVASPPAARGIGTQPSPPDTQNVELASNLRATTQRIDPENIYLWRWLPRRLEGEAIRDALLAVSGRLDTKSGGPSDKPGGGSRRRSLYLTQRRHELPASLAMFDGPTAHESCPRRHASTVPLQPLHLLNNAESMKHAEAFATRVRERAGMDQAAQVSAAFQVALNRVPDEAERVAAAKFFSAGTATNTLAQFCQALLNLNEFVYLE